MSPADIGNGDGGGQSAILITGGIFTILAIISVSLRFYTRRFTKESLGWDDWLLLAAVIAMLLVAILLLWGIVMLL